MKPILFNTDMVRAIQKGIKTATRRVVKEPYYIDESVLSSNSGFCMHRGTNVTDGMPYPDGLYQPGDILYVRETWGYYGRNWWEADYFSYRADYPNGATCFTMDGMVCDLPRWRPSIHMPREAARIFLRVTDVRVERLQAMSYEDAEQEGCWCDEGGLAMSLDKFADLWDSTIRPADRAIYGWDANPWVWVIEFERIRREEAMSSAN